MLNNIKKHRLRKGVTQQALASKIGTTQSYLSLIETGVRTPSLCMLKKIANALGCPLSLLLEEEGGCEEWKKNS